MKLCFFLFVSASLLLSVGCTGNSQKGMNKDLDRQSVPTAPTKRAA